MIRLILLGTFAILLSAALYYKTTSRTQSLIKLGTVLFFLCGAVAVILPSTTNRVAHALGVGRGADLLFYLVTVAFIAHVMITYMNRQEDRQRTTRIVRQMALLQAEQNEHNKRIRKKLKK